MNKLKELLLILSIDLLFILGYFLWRLYERISGRKEEKEVEKKG